MKSAAVWIFSFAATFWLATAAILYIGQRSFLYHPPEQWVEPDRAGASDFETIEIRPAPQRLRSWWRAPPTPDAPVILHFHGNASSLAIGAGIYQKFGGAEFGILAGEYPGYSGNDGDINETALFAAGQAHYDWLRQQGYKPKQIILAGHSLGTGVAVWLAGRNDAAGLLLESPYSSIRQVVQGRVPWIPVRYMLKDQYDSLSRIAGVNMPVAWAHGTADNVVPFASGEELFAAAKSPKCALRVGGGGHNNLWSNDVDIFFRRNVIAMVQKTQCIEIEE